MSNINYDYQFCVECGNPDFREPFNDGHKQCNDRNCLQEFFDDVDYGEITNTPYSYVIKLQNQLKEAENLIRKIANDRSNLWDRVDYQWECIKYMKKRW